MCAACATWTCSLECHTKYMSETNLCTFHHNFSKSLLSMVAASVLTFQSMRSIRLSVISKLHAQHLAQGTAVCKTSRAFMFAALGESSEHIFVQRGFRQYGQMQVLPHVTVRKARTRQWRW